MKKFTVLSIVFTAVIYSCGGPDGKNPGSGTANAEQTDAPVSQVIALSDSLIASRGADTVNMGRIRSGETVTRRVALRNDGDKPLVIIDVNKTCGCVDLDKPRQPIMPGQQFAFDLSFDSRGISGWVFKTVYLKTSSEKGNYTLVVTADVE